MKRAGLLVAAGALASIATSQVPTPQWALRQDAQVPPTAIDLQYPSARYLIRAELHGTASIVDVGGMLNTAITVRARTVPEYTFRTPVTLRSLTMPELEPSVAYLEVNTLGDRIANPSGLLWLACEGDPCVEEWELVVETDATRTDLTPLDITGTVTAHVSGTGDFAPADASVVITVTGPL